MMLLHSVYSILMGYIAFTQVLAVDLVTLSANALRIPGGYVVPERGNVTFTCNSSTGGALFWTVNFQIPGGTATFTTSLGLSRGVSSVTSRDRTPTANPASFTIHNITPKSNWSSVECFDIHSANSSATIIVEGLPNCPTVQSTVASEGLTISVQMSNMTWLPEHYHVKVTSHQNSSVVTVYNATLTNEEPFDHDVTSLQPDTVYNISITPCNIVGCSESCDIHSVRTHAVTTIVTSDPKDDVIVHESPSTRPIVFAGIACLTVLLLSPGILVIACVSVHLIKRRNKEKNIYDLQLYEDDAVGSCMHSKHSLQDKPML